MNKTEEMQLFLEYFPKHFSIFEKDNDIELNIGNTIIDKDILIRNFKEPGKKKNEFLCKHIINNFRVFRGQNYNSDHFITEKEVEVILGEFKDFLKSNKKRKTKSEKTETQKEQTETALNKDDHIINEDKHDKPQESQSNEVNWSFEWKININERPLIQGQIKSLQDLNNLMEQMKEFFKNPEKKEENNKSSITETSNLVEENTISFDKSFSLELTEDELNDLF